VGAAFGLLHATLTVPLALSQHVSGLGVTLLATSLSHFAYRTLLPNVTTPPRIEPFAPLAAAGSPLADLPVLGPLLLQQTPLTLLAYLLVALVAWVLYRTPLGLAVRTVGENPSRSRRRGSTSTASGSAPSSPAARSWASPARS
jgi:simple sugar transport system permease protein